MAWVDPWNMVFRHFSKVPRDGFEPQTLGIEDISLRPLGHAPVEVGWERGEDLGLLGRFFLEESSLQILAVPPSHPHAV